MNLPLVIRSKNQIPQQIVIDLVVTASPDSYHVSRITYGRRGFYDVARTYESPECPIDAHTSYHPSGEMHCKMTRGRSFIYPGGQLLGKAKPHTEANYLILWQRKGQAWASLKGVERVSEPRQGGLSFMILKALLSGYPPFTAKNADYVCEINAERFPSDFIGMEHFLVKPDNTGDLEDAIKISMGGWHMFSKSIILERVELFTDLTPWVALALLRTS